MGNNRFRLSDMIPNAWFYKLKDMGRTRNHSVTTYPLKKKQPTSATATVTATAQPSKPKHPHHSCPRKSYYITRELIPPSDQRFRNPPTNPKSSYTSFPDPPRKSSKQRVKRGTIRSSPKLVTSSVSAGCSCGATLRTKSDSPPDYSASSSDSSPEPEDSDSFPPEFRSDRSLATESLDNKVSWSSSCDCKLDSNANDIVINVDKQSLARKLDKVDGFDNISVIDLPPIITKTAKFDDEIEDIKKKLETKEPNKYRRSSAKYKETNAHGSLSVKVVKEESIAMKEQKNSSLRRHSVNSPGVRLRINSPRIASRRIQAHGRRSVSSGLGSCSRKSLSDSLAIVKSSFDPQRDFRDSMVEMIVENNIRASKDLEDLLACYLSLNADEYHDLIIKVFKQIWFDLTDIRLK